LSDEENEDDDNNGDGKIDEAPNSDQIAEFLDNKRIKHLQVKLGKRQRSGAGAADGCEDTGSSSLGGCKAPAQKRHKKNARGDTPQSVNNNNI
jgi:hypothetical protein